MFKRFFKRLRYRRLAAQLRQPKGKKGILTGQMMHESNRFMYDFTLQQMQVRDHETLLEIGFGNGQFFPKVSQSATGLKLYGIDHSALMLEEASRFNQVLVRNRQLTLVSGKSATLPWPDAFFDRIFCINVIYFWEQPLENLQEIKRVLKPCGRFYATCRSKENMRRMPFTAWQFTLYTPEEWEQVLIQAGLTPVIRQTAREPGLEAAGAPFAAEQWCVAGEKSTDL